MAEPEVNFDDPDFWEKLLPNANKQNPLIQLGARDRKKLQRFTYEDEEEGSGIYPCCFGNFG
jgi:hypothetical protein